MGPMLHMAEPVPSTTDTRQDSVGVSIPSLSDLIVRLPDAQCLASHRDSTGKNGFARSETVRIHLGDTVFASTT